MRHVYGCSPDRFQARIGIVKQFAILPTFGILFDMAYWKIGIAFMWGSFQCSLGLFRRADHD